jgi:hypothetical protein
MAFGCNHIRRHVFVCSTKCKNSLHLFVETQLKRLLISLVVESKGSTLSISEFTIGQSWASSIQLLPQHPVLLKYLITLCSNFLLGLPNGHCPRCFPPKFCMHFFLPICPACHGVLNFTMLTALGDLYEPWSFSLCNKEVLHGHTEQLAKLLFYVYWIFDVLENRKNNSFWTE